MPRLQLGLRLMQVDKPSIVPSIMVIRRLCLIWCCHAGATLANGKANGIADETAAAATAANGVDADVKMEVDGFVDAGECKNESAMCESASYELPALRIRLW